MRIIYDTIRGLIEFFSDVKQLLNILFLLCCFFFFLSLLGNLWGFIQFRWIITWLISGIFLIVIYKLLFDNEEKN